MDHSIFINEPFMKFISYLSTLNAPNNGNDTKYGSILLFIIEIIHFKQIVLNDRNDKNDKKYGLNINYHKYYQNQSIIIICNHHHLIQMNYMII